MIAFRVQTAEWREACAEFMSMESIMPKLPLLIPCLRYADAPAAIEFLCAAFGFERHAVFADDADPSIVAHAQLRLGDAMIMLSSDVPGEVRERYGWRTSAEAGGITMSVCAVLSESELERHYARAVAVGAVILSPLHANEGYPGSSYDARDPEGNVWNFGSYDPWAN